MLRITVKGDAPGQGGVAAPLLVVGMGVPGGAGSEGGFQGQRVRVRVGELAGPAASYFKVLLIVQLTADRLQLQLPNLVQQQFYLVRAI